MRFDGSIYNPVESLLPLLTPGMEDGTREGKL